VTADADPPVSAAVSAVTRRGVAAGPAGTAVAAITERDRLAARAARPAGPADVRSGADRDTADARVLSDRPRRRVDGIFGTVASFDCCCLRVIEWPPIILWRNPFGSINFIAFQPFSGKTKRKKYNR
jgi:hypothetical protein